MINNLNRIMKFKGKTIVLFGIFNILLLLLFFRGYKLYSHDYFQSFFTTLGLKLNINCNPIEYSIFLYNVFSIMVINTYLFITYFKDLGFYLFLRSSIKSNIIRRIVVNNIIITLFEIVKYVIMLLFGYIFGIKIDCQLFVILFTNILFLLSISNLGLNLYIVSSKTYLLYYFFIILCCIVFPISIYQISSINLILALLIMNLILIIISGTIGKIRFTNLYEGMN